MLLKVITKNKYVVNSKIGACYLKESNFTKILIDFGVKKVVHL